MRPKQISLDLSEVSVDESVQKRKQARQRWRREMQAYIDTAAQSKEAETTGWCVCGYMSFCEFCNGSAEKNACVNAVVEFCKEAGTAIDFDRTDYQEQLEELETIR